jgi:hypothetical protein
MFSIKREAVYIVCKGNCILIVCISNAKNIIDLKEKYRTSLTKGKEKGKNVSCIISKH